MMFKKLESALSTPPHSAKNLIWIFIIEQRNCTKKKCIKICLS